MPKTENKNILKLSAEEWIKSHTGLRVDDISINHYVELHWHNFFELEFIAEGSGHQNINGEKIEFKRGTVFLLRLTDYHEIFPDGDMHSYSIKIDESCFPHGWFTNLYSSNGVLHTQLDEETIKTVEKLFKLCGEENATASPDLKYIKNIIDCILLKTFKTENLNFNSSNLTQNSPLQKVLSYLNMHFRESPKLADVAKIAHYNTSYFSSTFYKNMGTSYSDYLNMLKVSYAKELLLSTNLKASDICFKCGFSSNANFLRVFKENVGIPPLAFRKKGKNPLR